MFTSIPISMLNDFVFCPYSIYLHNIYMEADEDTYHAVPQVIGKISHDTIDNKSYGSSKDIIVSLPVFSNRLGVYGVIDIYDKKRKQLTERKYSLKNIFRGQLYQLWAQYYCMIEMGYSVEKIAFYEKSTNVSHFVSVPSEEDILELKDAIERVRCFSLDSEFVQDAGKCSHCIYVNLCDKTKVERNVYQ